MGNNLVKSLSFRKEEFEFIGSILRSNGNLTIVTPYGTGIRRLFSILEEPAKVLKYFPNSEIKKRIFIYYDCSFGEELFKETMEASLSRYIEADGLLKQVYRLVDAGYKITIICNEFDFKLRKIADYVNLIGEVKKGSTNIMVSMSPAQYFSDSLEKFQNSTIISHNLLHIKLLTDEESEYWCRAYCKENSISLSSKEIKKVVNFSGGIVSIMRNILSEYEKSRSVQTAMYSESVKNIINIVWLHLTEEEKSCLRDVVIKGASVKSEVYKYLSNYNFFNKAGGLRGEWIDFIENPKVAKKLKLVEKSVYFGTLNISKALTDVEQAILVKVISNKDGVVTRDDISSIRARSGVESETTWALDKFMSRFKTKLQNIGYPDYKIKTVKGVGYRFLN